MQFDNILEIMSKKGVTQKQLADALRVSTGKVSDWKKGTISSWNKRLPEIADFLGVSIDELAGNEKKPAISDDDELSEEEVKIIKLYRAASAELKAAVQRIVKES